MSKSIKPQTGWMVFNYDIPVFPTLAHTRREAIDIWSGDDKNRWKSWQKRGAVEVKKIRLSFA